MTTREKRACRETASGWRRASQLVLLACALACGSATATGETLRQVVETALKTNPKVLAADAQRRAAVHDIAQARAGYLPTLDVNLAGGRERTDSPDTRLSGTNNDTLSRQEAGVLLSQNLFNGKGTTSEVERLNARLEVATKRLAELREDIALRATEVFLDVLKNRELVRLAEASLKAHLQTQDKVRQRVSGGVSQRSDLQQAEGRVALARSVLSARAGALRESEANFQATVGKRPAELDNPIASAGATIKPAPVDTAALAQSLKQASDAAVASSPTLGAANAEITAAEASVRGARAPYFPRLNLELNANRNENVGGTRGRADNESLMLVLRWNLFRGGGDRAQERALAERRYAAIDTAASARRDVEERVAVALYARATSAERLLFLQEHSRLSGEVLESYQQQLDLGRRTLLDVLNAENEVFTARSNLAAGRYEDRFNEYAIEAAKGTLVKSLGITLAD